MGCFELPNGCKESLCAYSLSSVPNDSLLAELNRRKAVKQKASCNIIVIGPPGSGKGSLAPFLCSQLLLKYVNFGQLVKQEIAKKTPLGMRAAQDLGVEDCISLCETQLESM